MTNRADIRATLEARRAVIAGRFGAHHLGVFGSAARAELRPDSGIDVLFEFEGPATFDRCFDLKDFFEETFAVRWMS